MIVFAGPSLAGASGVPDGIEMRPPAQQGDVYLASLETPAAIGIIDGYFEGVPSVWLKEILWALKRGIPVLGASSMGALRAAELDIFGMIGVGMVYALYRDGVLEDDDEVALVHGPAEVGYPGLSLAMVSARATLDAAVRDGVLTADQAAALASGAKSQFYKQRTWDSILRVTDVGKADAVFRSWLADNEVDQKRADALALLQRLVEGRYEPPVVDFHFEETALWHDAVQLWRQRQREAGAPREYRYRVTGGLSFRDM